MAVMVDKSCITILFILVRMIHSQYSRFGSDPVDLQKYLQPNIILDKDYFNETSCYRPCEEGAAPKICYYKWILEEYKTMGPACKRCPEVLSDCFRPQCITADGYERGLLTVNHLLPGPSIQVCLGDRIIVDVTNSLMGQSTAVHWHGLHQRGTPHMDGVPMLTQCPIAEMTTFRYDFKANNEGTLYWHSHDGFQKQDGLQGNIVVRTPKWRDPAGHLYDYDLASHVIFISDWMHRAAAEHFPGLQTHDYFQEPDSLLINGRGRYLKGDKHTEKTPYSVFRMTKGKRYRFRLVGGTCTSCSYQFSIHNHPLLILSVDGCPVEPVLVDSIVLYGGERYDFVVEASQDIKSYWMHLRVTGTCKDLGLYSLAVLRYNGDTSASLSDPGYHGHYDGKIINMYNATCTSTDVAYCMTQLTSLKTVHPLIKRLVPDFSFMLYYGFHNFYPDALFQPGGYERHFEPTPNRLLSSTINNISLEMPSSPILFQRDEIDPANFCPLGRTGMPACPEEKAYCNCVHLIQVPLGAVVEFVLVGKGTGPVHHPFHLHGYSFNVITMGQFKYGEDEFVIMDRLRNGSIPLAPAPVHKDTIAIPSCGYGVVRIVANNPGYWFFHCHILYHADTGMALILQVGDEKDIPRPPAGFPKCGNYMPPVHNDFVQRRKMSGGVNYRG